MVFFREWIFSLSLCKNKQQCRQKAENWQELIGFTSIPLITWKRYGVWWMLWILNIWFPVCLYVLTPCNFMKVKTSRIRSEILIIPAFFLSWISLLFPSQLPNIHPCSMCDYLPQLPALLSWGFRSPSENWPSFTDLTCNQEVDLVLWAIIVSWFFLCSFQSFLSTTPLFAYPLKSA